MSSRIGGLEQQFQTNFERNVVSDVAQNKDSGDDKGKVGGTAAAPTKDAYHTTGAEPVQVQVMQYMMAAYNSNTDDIMDKGNQMQAATYQADQLSAASAAITSAQLQAGSGSVTVDVVPDGDPKADSNSGSTAYITQSQYDEMKANGLQITSGSSIDSSDLSGLLSSINNIQETLNGNTEYTMLQLQTDTQNQTQDSSMASGTLKSIGDSISGVARNVGG
jgi:hypothetical protein